MSDFASVIKTLLDGLRDVEITRYSHLSSSTIVVLDHLLTVDQEVDLIWGSSWSLGKVLFLLNRYYSLAATAFNVYSHLLPNQCLHYFRWQGWTALVAAMLAQGILQIRIYALYSLNKKILALLLSSFLVCIMASGWILQSSLQFFQATALTIPGGKFCVPSGAPPHFFTFWIPILTFETLLCVLALIRGFQTFKSNGSLFHSGRQLVGILVRDSVLYFIVIFIAYLVNLLAWLAAPPNLREVPAGFSFTMSCVLGNRVVLNVRKVSREVSDHKALTSQGYFDNSNTSFGSPGTLTDIEMAHLRDMRSISIPNLNQKYGSSDDEGEEESAFFAI